jgi:hypothetical protein
MINPNYYKKLVCITTALVTVTTLFVGCAEKKEQPTSPIVKETPKVIVSTKVECKLYKSKIGYNVLYPNILTKFEENEKEDAISMKSSDGLYTLKFCGTQVDENSTGESMLAEAQKRVAHITDEYSDTRVYRLEYEGGGDGKRITFYEYGVTMGGSLFTFIFSYPSEEKNRFEDVIWRMSNDLEQGNPFRQPVEKADFTYNIIDETYTEEGITIKFPQLNKASNEAKADSINKVIQESIRMKLDSLRKGQKDMGAFSLDLKYEIAGYDNKVLSIFYQGTSHFEKAAYPVNIYHTQNITLGEVNTLALKDIFIIDDRFVEAFKSGNYSPSRDDLDLEKSGVNLKETIESQYSNKELVNLFQKQEVNYKLTMYGVIISIEVPHAIGDHLEMAIPYEAVEANMIKGSPVWKDYLFIK